MRQIKKKDYSSYYSLLLILIAIAIVYFFINPYIAQLKQVNIDIGAKEKENQQLSTNLNSLVKLKSEFESKKDLVDKLNIAIPDGDDIPNTLMTIDAIASKNGIDVGDISQQSGSDVSSSSNFEFAFVSSYDGLKLLLESFEENIRYITPESISISKSQEEEGSSDISVDMNIGFYKNTTETVTSETTENDEGQPVEQISEEEIINE